MGVLMPPGVGERAGLGRADQQLVGPQGRHRDAGEFCGASDFREVPGASEEKHPHRHARMRPGIGKERHEQRSKAAQRPSLGQRPAPGQIGQQLEMRRAVGAPRARKGIRQLRRSRRSAKRHQQGRER